MYIILGASGQVGSAVVDNLLQQGKPVKAIIRDQAKADALKKAGATVAIANANNLDDLIRAFNGGDTLFVLTPESEMSENIIGDTKTILNNYRKAVEASGIETIIGLSSMGAQHPEGTGNLKMSYLLEHAFLGLSARQVFIRPAYYFSNWLPYLDTVKKDGVLPTFFPVEMPLPMVARNDVAELISKVLVGEDKPGTIYELEGPGNISSNDVAKAFAVALQVPVKAVQTPHDKWAEALKKVGMTTDGVKNFIEMTDAVIAGKAQPERGKKKTIKGHTTINKFLENAVKNFKTN